LRNLFLSYYIFTPKYVRFGLFKYIRVYYLYITLGIVFMTFAYLVCNATIPNHHTFKLYLWGSCINVSYNNIYCAPPPAPSGVVRGTDHFYFNGEQT